MFTEKNLPRLIIATPIITVLLFAVLIIYFFIISQYANFEQESIALEKEYILRQKDILKNENDRVHEYIRYHRELNRKRTHAELRKREKSGETISNDYVDAYEKNAKLKLQKQVIDWIESIRYMKNGYVWVHDTSHRLIAHPFRKASIGSDDTNNTDAKGAKIFQLFVRAATQNKDGGFVEYYWARPQFEQAGKKIGFFRLDEPWGWVIGTGLYIDDIEGSILLKKQNLETKIDRYVRIISLVALSLMIVLGVISLLISQTIVRVFTSYREKVSKKEQSLKEFNKTLTVRINEALEEAKKRDQALLHKSRLAQMGEMISMIAHQWRQPLSEVSGIFMEMETAAKFGKADRKFIERESKEGYKFVNYMSNTIDDFSNFFKPAKTKETFSVTHMCKKAITLAQASLKNKDINLTLHVKEDTVVNGYPSEYAQVILNLILNAKETLIERDSKDPTIKIIVDKKEGKSQVSVSDNGGGVDEYDEERIFEPYFSTKKVSGTGLGLYMSKMIIEENMGGEIFAKNGPQGANFIIKVNLA
jgi:signal transduction histidine kinase